MYVVQKMLATQIRDTMRVAMKDLLTDTFKKEKLETKDLAWIKELCIEIIQRINQLTPNRTDLHQQLESSIDVELIIQMLNHSAIEISDFVQILNVTFDRLKLLCAPSQDIDIDNTKNNILQQPTLSESIVNYILESNRIIDEIEDLYRDFKTKTNVH